MISLLAMDNVAARRFERVLQSAPNTSTAEPAEFAEKLVLLCGLCVLCGSCFEKPPLLNLRHDVADSAVDRFRKAMQILIIGFRRAKRVLDLCEGQLRRTAGKEPGAFERNGGMSGGVSTFELQEHRVAADGLDDGGIGDEILQPVFRM